MRPNFEEMSVPDLRAYVLKHRDDIDAIRVLFHHPTLKWKTMPPMFTKEGVPIEENIQIGEEALKQRIEQENNSKQNPQTSNKYRMITVTPAEIENFRSQLTNYPEASAALDLIEQRNGNLETAANILAIRAGYEPSRKSNLLEELSEKCRKVICQEEFREDLAAGLIVVVVEPLATSVGIPPGLATAIAIYAFKTGVKKFCQPTDSES